jgi:hypothetical protein
VSVGTRRECYGSRQPEQHCGLLKAVCTEAAQEAHLGCQMQRWPAQKVAAPLSGRLQPGLGAEKWGGVRWRWAQRVGAAPSLLAGCLRWQHAYAVLHCLLGPSFVPSRPRWLPASPENQTQAPARPS